MEADLSQDHPPRFPILTLSRMSEKGGKRTCYSRVGRLPSGSTTTAPELRRRWSTCAPSRVRSRFRSPSNKNGRPSVTLVPITGRDFSDEASCAPTGVAASATAHPIANLDMLTASIPQPIVIAVRQGRKGWLVDVPSRQRVVVDNHGTWTSLRPFGCLTKIVVTDFRSAAGHVLCCANTAIGPPFICKKFRYCLSGLTDVVSLDKSQHRSTIAFVTPGHVVGICLYLYRQQHRLGHPLPIDSGPSTFQVRSGSITDG